MILADKIIDERKKCGWSQEELADKLGVSRQSVSKWESAQSVPDLQRILEMSKIFGVSTDYLLKDEEGVRTNSDSEYEGVSARRVSMEEANEYLAETEKFSGKIAIGACLCVASPVILIGCLALQRAGILFAKQNTAIAVGVLMLLGLVTTAVAIFIPAGLANGKWSWLGREIFDTEYGVDGMVRSRQERFQPSFVMNITLGVIMILAGVIGVAVSAMLAENNEALILGMTCLLLVLIAVAVFRFVRVGIVKNSYSVLLQENDYTKAAKQTNGVFGAITTAYWLFVTAGFLLWGFLADGWQYCWLVWPIAGILFAAFSAIAHAAKKQSE
ncbi:MAG: helix-turn-helix transcriptional regulator [Lachnospiraceae bacterium]|nr:helix-turn-helix transcriptional regulator [Lachnospiraceae bacterium]